jgi:hypothetical protein
MTKYDIFGNPLINKQYNFYGEQIFDERKFNIFDRVVVNGKNHGIIEGFSGQKAYFVRLDNKEHKEVFEYNIERE